MSPHSGNDWIHAARAWPLGRGVSVAAAHESGLVAFAKPAGVMAHPNRPAEQAQALLQAPYDLEKECYLLPGVDGKTTPVWLLNRIDSPTSGLVLGAANPEVVAIVRELFRRNAVRKTYCAVVRGARLHPPQGWWRDRLTKNRTGGVVRAGTGAGGVPAVSEYRWLRADRLRRGVSLVELAPHTGRTHQLRVQCASHGFPIVGDKTYGDFSFNQQMEAKGAAARLFLHAAQLAVPFRWKGQDVTFAVNAPLPKEFSDIMGESGEQVPISPSRNIRVRLPRR